MSPTILPLARQDGLKIQPIADETLIFDTASEKAFVLNPSAAAVWRACNGQRTIPQLVRHLSRETPTDEQTVWYALAQLSELLREPVTPPPEFTRLSRRKFLQQTGLVAAAAAVPIVISMVAPPPAAAASVINFCCLCNNGTQTQTGTCEDCDTFCSDKNGKADCSSGNCHDRFV